MTKEEFTIVALKVLTGMGIMYILLQLFSLAAYLDGGM
jgi:hypothetical protein